MNILVIGNFCWDCYGSVETELSMEPGGIMYSLYAFSSVMKKGDLLFPVFPVETSLFEQIKSGEFMLPQVELSGIYKMQESNSKVLVTIRENQEPDYKVITGYQENVKTEFLPDQKMDGIYLNFQTGHDWDLAALKVLREKYPDAFIHTDIHSLAYEIAVRNKNDKENAFQELNSVFQISDSLQFNQQELTGMIFATGKTEKELVKAAIVNGRAKAVIITKGERGVVCYEKVLNQIETHVLRPITVHRSNFPIGSGDVLGSVFLNELLVSKGIRHSIVKGMKLAELAVSKEGFRAKVEHVRINGALL